MRSPPSRTTTGRSPPVSMSRTRTPSRKSAPASAARSARKWSRRRRWVMWATGSRNTWWVMRRVAQAHVELVDGVLHDGAHVEGEDARGAPREAPSARLVAGERHPVEEDHARALAREPVGRRRPRRTRAHDRHIDRSAHRHPRRPAPSAAPHIMTPRAPPGRRSPAPRRPRRRRRAARRPANSEAARRSRSAHVLGRSPAAAGRRRARGAPPPGCARPWRASVSPSVNTARLSPGSRTTSTSLERRVLEDRRAGAPGRRAPPPPRRPSRPAGAGARRRDAVTRTPSPSRSSVACAAVRNSVPNPCCRIASFRRASVAAGVAASPATARTV